MAREGAILGFDTVGNLGIRSEGLIEYRKPESPFPIYRMSLNTVVIRARVQILLVPLESCSTCPDSFACFHSTLTYSLPDDHGLVDMNDGHWVRKSVVRQSLNYQ
jgi:hypothetical protein